MTERVVKQLLRMMGQLSNVAVLAFFFGTAFADHGGPSHYNFNLVVPATSSTGTYTVTWASGTMYDLEERVGTGPYSVAYRGTAGIKAFSGKSNGTYTYRIVYEFCLFECVYFYSYPESIVVSGVLGTPSAITGPDTDDDGIFQLSWGTVSGATTYTLDRQPDGGSWSTVQNTSASTYNESGLANGTYYYRVKACDSSTCGNWTASKTVIVDSGGPPPPPPSDEGNPPPNPSATIGQTLGQATVSITGEGIYSIPIFAPPGVNQLTPEISLVYAHRQDESLAGVGWTLSGLSAIKRCAKTIAQDGESKAIGLTLEDRFCLDGNQLRLISGTYGATGSEYRTERDTVAKILANGTAGNGPASFTVYQKGGLIYEYGNSTDSRIESLASGFTTTAHTWAVNEIRDRSGNEIQFIYQEDGAPNGEYRISEIKYRANPGLGQNPGYSIKYEYESQPSGDVDTQYVSGGKVVDTKRLDRIDVYYLDASPDQLVRRYELTYETSLSSASRSRLAKIEECAGSPLKCLAPLNFEYQDGTEGLASEVLSGSSIPYLTEPLAIDINGDGFTDLVYPSSQTSGQWMYRLANGSGGYESAVNSGISSVEHEYAIPIDYNSDGLDDFLVPYSGGTWWAIQGSSSGLLAPIDTGAPLGLNLDPGNTRAFDLNGDGRDDLVWRRLTGTAQFSVERRYRRESGGFELTATSLITDSPGWVTHPLWKFDQSRANHFDVNGDGQKDLGILRSAGSTYYTKVFLGGGGEWTANTGLSISSAHPIDINGDGYTDIAYQEFSQGNLRFQLSTGKEFQAAVTGPSLTNLSLLGAVVTDWDGDGYEDLVIPSLSTGTWYYIRSLGESFAAAVNTGLTTGGAYSSYPIDANGDGLIDVGYVRSDDQIVHRLRAGIKADLLTKITDGHGNETLFSYVPITQGAYTKRTDAILPDIDYVGPIYVVDQLERNTGIDNNKYTVDYTYEGLQHHIQGRQLVGFRKRSATDNRNGIVTTEEYRQDFPFQGLLLDREIRLSDSTLVRSETYTWNSHSGGSGNQYYSLPYLGNSLIENFEVGGFYNGSKKNSISASFVVDSYGTVTDTTTITNEPSSANGIYPNATYTETIRLTGITNNLADWCLGMPSQTQAINSHSLTYGAAITRTITHVWDPNNCRIYFEIVEPASNTYKVTRDLLYDGFGNVKNESVTGINMPVRTSTTDWGSKGNLPISVTNALGQTTSYGWDFAIGETTSATDPNGIVSTWDYDNFGRPIQGVREDGSYIDMVTSPCTPADSYCSTGYSRVKTMVRRESRGPSGEFIRYDDLFFDRLDRPIQIHGSTLTGVVSMTRTIYNNEGRVSQVSMPTLNATPAYYTTISYDSISRPSAVSRPISASNPGSQSVNIYYEGLTTRSVDAEVSTSWKITDASGQVVRSKDHSGYYQDFDYDAFKSLRRVRDSLSNNLWLQTLAYGLDAFRTSSTDMDIGNWTFTPNALGEVVAYTDAKGQSFSASYDKLSRIKTRAEPDGTTTWYWGNSAAANSIGRLQYVSSPGFFEYYSYDASGRLSQRSTTTDAIYYTNLGYSSTTALLESLTYPVSTSAYRLKIKYTYQNGILKRVSNFDVPSTVFWEAEASDARGNVIDEVLGNGLQTIRGYDPVTGWLDFVQSGPSAGTANQNLEYLWNKVGSLTQRKDDNRFLTEDFYYDSLHRLDYSHRNSVQNLDVDYDQMGNITYKDDVGGGTWSYHASKKHAVTNASGNTYSYDNNGNVTIRNGDWISWKSFNLPSRINHSGGYHDFHYDANRSRYKQVYNGGSAETTIFVGGLLEKRTAGSTTEYRHHIKVNGQPVALYTRPTSGGNTIEYFLRDHMGSVDSVTNSTGGVVVNESFAAFGERRDPNDWSGPPSSGDQTLIAGATQRGYTYHTNLEGDSLIHMNGRVADAHTGRFLSADPFIPDPSLTQAFNRYSYVYNNPLSYTDPSGYLPDGGIITISVVGTVGSFIKGLFGKKKPPPKGCFVAATACYGQAGMTRVPGFGGIITSNWESQPLGIQNIALNINGGIPSPDELRRENISQFWKDMFWGACDWLICGTVDEVKETYEATRDGHYGRAILGVGLTICDAVKGCKIVDRVSKGARTWAKKLFGKKTDVSNPMARGRATEKRVLDDLGLEKNKQRVSTAEGNSVPDALTNNKSLEIKDCNVVSCTRQVRIQTDAARASARESVLITGKNTHVTKQAEEAFDTIIRLDDLGQP